MSDVRGQFDLGEKMLRRWIKQVNFEHNGGMRKATVLTAKRREERMPKKQTQKFKQEKSSIKTSTALSLTYESTSALDPKGALTVIEDLPDLPSMLTTLAIPHPPALAHAANAARRPVHIGMVATETTRDRSA